MSSYFDQFFWPGLTVTCPICKRPPKTICCTWRGSGLFGKPHRTRLKYEQLEIQKQTGRINE
jgi:hypothetical protein